MKKILGQEVDIVEYMGKSVPKIHATLENKQENYYSHMIEVEGKIDDQPIDIFIDSRASHSYVDPNMIDRFKLKRSKNDKYWLVHLAIGTKRRIKELVIDFLMNMNGFNTKENFNIIPLGLYDFLIGMDWLDKHHAVLYFYKKDFACLDEEVN
jgi:hypothetical protein